MKQSDVKPDSPASGVLVKVKTNADTSAYAAVCGIAAAPQHKGSSQGKGGAGPCLWPSLQQFLLVKELTLGSDS